MFNDQTQEDGDGETVSGYCGMAAKVA